MPRVELLADSDFEPAAVPRVDGLNLLGAAGKQKLEKGVPSVKRYSRNSAVSARVGCHQERPTALAILFRPLPANWDRKSSFANAYRIGCNPSVGKRHPRDDRMALSRPET